MFNSQKRVSLPWRSLVKPVEKSIAGLLLTAGLAAGSVMMPIASSKAADLSGADLPNNDVSLTDGVYVYGQSTEPNQIGSEYLVFEVNQGKVVGGFYMPRSSFDCFYGNVESDKLALTVIDSYEQTRHPYDVALQTEGSIAQATGETTLPVGLEGYHRLDTLTEVDQQVLTTCRADHQI